MYDTEPFQPLDVVFVSCVNSFWKYKTVTMFCLPIDFRNSGNNDYKNGNKCQRYVTFNVFKLHKLRFLVASYTQNFDIRYKNICDLRFFERAFGAPHIAGEVRIT